MGSSSNNSTSNIGSTALDLGSSLWNNSDGGGDGDGDGGGGRAGGRWPTAATWTDPTDIRERERVRIMANWDPCFPSEHVSWYDEYIQRHGPVAVNWFQFAHDTAEERRGPLSPDELVEARGVALYYPESGGGRGERLSGETILAVSPLDDGGVCLWDVGGTRGRRGAIVARSRPGILFVDGPGADNRRRSKRIDSGVTECVSVDSWRHRAFFAVQSRKCALERLEL